jgi:hypothetical protein
MPRFNSLWELEHTKRLMLALPIYIRGGIVPVAYNRDPEQHWIGRPDPVMFAALLKAKQYLDDGHSLTKVVRWYQSVTGTNTNQSSMLRIMRDRRPLQEIIEYSEDEREKRFTGPIDYWAEAPIRNSRNAARRNATRARNSEKESSQTTLETTGESDEEE